MPTNELNDTNRSSINVYLQSDNATQSLGESHKVFDFQNSISVPPDQDIVVGLTNFSMANTLYNINSGFNTITINDPIGESHTLTLTPKNYTAFQMYEELNDLIEANNSLKSANVAVSFDNQTYKFTFSADSNINITACSFSHELGLENQLPTGNFTSYTANDTCFLGGLDTLYIGVSNLGIENFDSRGEIENTIASINIPTNSSYYVFYDEPEHHYFLVKSREIKKFEIKLTDHKDRLLVLNGGQFNLTLSFHFIFKRQNKILREYYLEPPKEEETENDKKNKK